jgi:hypothetical protein
MSDPVLVPEESWTAQQTGTFFVRNDQVLSGTYAVPSSAVEPPVPVAEDTEPAGEPDVSEPVTIVPNLESADVAAVEVAAEV